MPNIPAMNLTGTNLNIQEVYEEGLFNPADPPDSFDILNGLMDEDNLVGSDIIPAFTIQPGAVVSGVYMPFERWHFVYGRQLSGDDTRPVAVAGLCARLFKPWDANFIMYGYQAWCRQDAGAYSTNGTISGDTNVEYWDLSVRANGGARAALDARLPHGRARDDYGSTESVLQNERRWRYVAKVGAFKRNVDADTLLDKGYLSLQVRAWANLVNPGSDTEPDAYNAKLIIPTGGMWVLAFR